MKVELLAYTQANPALSPAVVAGVSDIAALWEGKGTYAENIMEYAGRVCYKSTDRMGTAPNFVQSRVREAHEDIIEHAVVTVRVTGSTAPLRWRIYNRHCEVTEREGGSWIVSGNTRVWLDFFRRGIGLEALPILRCIAPSVYAELDDTTAEGTTSPSPQSASPVDTERLLPAQFGSMRVTLLGYTQPLLGEMALLRDHGSATFFFEGISRACTHQLVRHRLGSFSQESQRYVDLRKGDWGAIVPESILANPEAQAILTQTWQGLQENYAALRALGIRKEDARFLLPNAAETRIVTTMNMAAWQHFLWLRAVDKAAQWEIRTLGQRVLEMLYTLAPELFREHWRVYERDFIPAPTSTALTPSGS